MTDIRQIIHRLRQGQSQRLIHRELGIHRSIIRELYDLSVMHQWLNSEFPMPSNEDIAKVREKKANNESHPLDIYKEQLRQWDKEGLSSVVIQRLLKDRCPCDVQVIRRFRKKHFQKPVEPVMVRTTVPGRDMELDFGELGKFLDEDGKIKKVWLFSLRLRHSRKAYREIVLDQTIPTFLMGHAHAFEHFNGVPQNSILDNLKAGVIRSTIDNDMINRSYQEFAEHYGFIISPCLPRTPQHKGGVEGDVKYAKSNFLPYFLATQKEMGIKIPKIRDLIEALEKWDKEVVDVHLIHGIGRSPLDIFKSEEEKQLRPLPKNRWEPTSWVQCVVRREWRIMINCAYYSVPYHLINQTVEVCLTPTFVRIFYENKEVALHEPATEKWEYKRKTEHAPPFHEAVLQSSREGLLQLAKDIGSFTHQIAIAILSHSSVDKLKPVRYLLQLAKKYTNERLEKACQRAFNCKMFSYKSVKNILENNLDSQPLDIVKEAKIIPLPHFRFATDPTDYKISHDCEKRETFDDKLERLCPYSRHGNAMLKGMDMVLADQAMDEELKSKK
ncbi:MAG: IS21 family transposase [Chlamydiales bacterium]